MLSKLKFSKNVNSKRCATKLNFFNKKNIFWKLQFLKHLKHFLLKLCPFFVSWIWSFGKKYIWKWLKGHFWSMAKVVIRIGCATWNSNLKSYLLNITYDQLLAEPYIFWKKSPLALAASILYSSAESVITRVLEIRVWHFLNGI